MQLKKLPLVARHWHSACIPPRKDQVHFDVGEHLMPSVAPAARVAFIVEAMSRLRRLQREMARLSMRDKNYESNQRALQAAIQELRKMISANTQ
jgi:hypothetical protein